MRLLSLTLSPPRVQFASKDKDRDSLPGNKVLHTLISECTPLIIVGPIIRRVSRQVWPDIKTKGKLQPSANPVTKGKTPEIGTIVNSRVIAVLFVIRY